MIDWETAIFPCTHSEFISGGLIVSSDRSGKVEWEAARRLSVEGSHSSVIQVKTVSPWDGSEFGIDRTARVRDALDRQNRGEDSFTSLWISGNPAKFLQGHNLFGTDDLLGLNCLFYDKLTQVLGLTPSRFDRKRIEEGSYNLSRVDVTAMLPLGTQETVQAFLKAAMPVVRGKHQGTSAYGGETIYIGQHSKRITTKLYNKILELKKHPLPEDIAYREELMGFVEDQLRVEVCLRSRELRDRGLCTVANWTNLMASTLVAERLKSMNLPEKMKLPKATIKGLPGRLVGVYRLWEDGEDLRSLYPRRTFYRYRLELLKHGVDISVQCSVKPGINVIPMVKYIIAEYRGTGKIPDFARGTELYADPSARRVA